MKVLFIIFHGFDPSNGISKKVAYQVDALKANGMDVRLCYMDETAGKRRVVGQQVIADYGSGFMSKIRKRTEFASIARYAAANGIGLVYIRSNHNANPFTISMVKQMKRAGMKVVMEIPTYPYDAEYKAQGISRQIFQDKLFRRLLARHLDAIVYSETDSDFDHMPYVLKAPADESPVDICQIIAFYQRLTLKPSQIRASIAHLSWENQMKKVISSTALSCTCAAWSACRS